jgi:hypothetical protein
VILVTTYYDMCSLAKVGGENGLPTWAWHFSDFLGDVRTNGLTNFNRIYVLSRWRGLWRGSVMVADRGVGSLLQIVDRLRPGYSAPDANAIRTAHIAKVSSDMERDVDVCDDVGAKMQLAEILEYFRARKLDVTVVAFPIDPALISPVVRDRTLRLYSDYLRSIEPKYGFRRVDLTLDSPMVDDDFQADLDHVRPERRRKFADWATDLYFRFLLEPSVAGQSGAGAGTR